MNDLERKEIEREKRSMSNINVLSQQVEMMYGRLSKLYHNVSSCDVPSPEMLPVTLKELGVAAEELQVAVEHLTEQNTHLKLAQSQVGEERERYQELFDLVPDGYLVTDAASTIREANQRAGELLQIQPRFLTGKPLINLVYHEDRSFIRSRLNHLAHRDRLELSVRLHQRNGAMFDAGIIITAVRDAVGNPQRLHWLIRDITEQKRAEAALSQPSYNPCHDRVLRFYSRGETIPLDPQTLWMVARGVVKLTTLSDTGVEMLIGLAADSMIFGSDLTKLPVYQATALIDVQLAAIPRSELANSPRLAQTLFPAIKHRLQQTESFLAIYGQLRVEDRLNQLLQLLKQEVGDLTEQGIRLRCRLTHQDFAGACCTTRVTITRLLRKLQHEKKVTLDAYNHLIVHE